MMVPSVNDIVTLVMRTGIFPESIGFFRKSSRANGKSSSRFSKFIFGFRVSQRFFNFVGYEIPN